MLTSLEESHTLKEWSMQFKYSSSFSIGEADKQFTFPPRQLTYHSNSKWEEASIPSYYSSQLIGLSLKLKKFIFLSTERVIKS